MSLEHWELKYDPRVRKQLERIRDTAVIGRIEEAARGLKNRPYSGKPLRGYPGVWSKRVASSGGEYRIIYIPVKTDRVIFIVLVASREEVYKLLKRNPP